MTAAPTPPVDAFSENPSDCPAWVKEVTPDWTHPFHGRFGMPEPWRSMQKSLGGSVRGIDRWQANHFIMYREETAAYLDHDYTPLKVNYLPGTLPSYEKLAAQYTQGLTSDREKAIALLTRALPDRFRHPTIMPLGKKCGASRNLDDEALLATETGFCNEQARVFVRLCQVLGIPARMIYLFYSDNETGHVVNEFYADGKWMLADPSWYCVFPGADGLPMSSAEAHDPKNKTYTGAAYYQRMQELLAMSDEALYGRSGDEIADPQQRAAEMAQFAEKARKGLQSKDRAFCDNWLWKFGVLNYPLPPQ